MYKENVNNNSIYGLEVYVDKAKGATHILYLFMCELAVAGDAVSILFCPFESSRDGAVEQRLGHEPHLYNSLLLFPSLNISFLPVTFPQISLVDNSWKSV